jgi:hypothetical protein
MMGVGVALIVTIRPPVIRFEAYCLSRIIT